MIYLVQRPNNKALELNKHFFLVHFWQRSKKINYSPAKEYYRETKEYADRYVPLWGGSASD